jgi:hypothetical protein
MIVTSTTNHPEALAKALEAYRRLAAMDPPAMRSLVVELTRLANDSSASAVQRGTAEAAARAGRNAERAAAARVALASVETEG